MATGWREINGNWLYFVPETGYRVTYTWYEIGGRRYYFGEDGIAHTGWIEDEGGTRFCAVSYTHLTLPTKRIV